jgi:hypothetical protein
MLPGHFPKCSISSPDTGHLLRWLLLFIVRYLASLGMSLRSQTCQDSYSNNISIEDCLVSTRFVLCMTNLNPTPAAHGWYYLHSGSMNVGVCLVESECVEYFSSHLSYSTALKSRPDNKDLGSLGAESCNSCILMHLLRRCMDPGICCHGHLGKHTRVWVRLLVCTSDHGSIWYLPTDIPLPRVLVPNSCWPGSQSSLFYVSYLQVAIFEGGTLFIDIAATAHMLMGTC